MLQNSKPRFTPWKRLMLLLCVSSFTSSIYLACILKVFRKELAVALQYYDLKVAWSFAASRVMSQPFFKFMTQLLGMLGTSGLYLWLVGDRPLRGFFKKQRAYVWPVLVTCLLGIVCIVPNLFLLNWNASIFKLGHFSSVKPFMAVGLSETYSYLVLFSICIMAPVCEELLFRGILQKIVTGIVNQHLAILFTSLYFAVAHGQPQAILNRWMLGMLFGYLYRWSGNLIFPIIAHAVNNSIVLGLGLYVQDHKNMLTARWLVITASGLMCVLLYYFRALMKKPTIKK